MKQEQFQEIAFKISKLAEHLDCSPDDIQTENYTDGDCFRYRNELYRVLTDEDSDSAAEEYIKDTLWAFNPDWLASHAISDDIGEDVFRAIQDNGKCEGNNSAIKALVDLDYLIRDSILADGRGVFIASYDHEEIELNQGYYAYRIS